MLALEELEVLTQAPATAGKGHDQMGQLSKNLSSARQRHTNISKEIHKQFKRDTQIFHLFACYTAQVFKWTCTQPCAYVTLYMLIHWYVYFAANAFRYLDKNSGNKH